ncbi:hypothetical protein C8J57DRAFT_1212733 [Mycena rebaudengoi]|nr:hypothetical protein C8J57DRAFT_1212733 [Mycena rebaudengoi]
MNIYEDVTSAYVLSVAEASRAVRRMGPISPTARYGKRCQSNERGAPGFHNEESRAEYVVPIGMCQNEVNVTLHYAAPAIRCRNYCARPAGMGGCTLSPRLPFNYLAPYQEYPNIIVPNLEAFKTSGNTGRKYLFSILSTYEFEGDQAKFKKNTVAEKESGAGHSNVFTA